MGVFLIIGGIGVAVVAISLLLGDVLDGVFEFEHFELADGLLSTPVVGAFLAAFGFGGALLTGSADLAPALATAGGLGAGVVVGGGTLWLTRALMRMPTDATPRTGDLVGHLGTVITPIPATGFGEVSVTAAGQRLKLNARADTAIAKGASVVVVEVTSPTAVIVTESNF